MKLTAAQWNELLVFTCQYAQSNLDHISKQALGPEFLDDDTLESMINYLEGEQEELSRPEPAPEDLRRQFEESFMDPERDGLEEMGDAIVDREWGYEGRYPSE